MGNKTNIAAKTMPRRNPSRANKSNGIINQKPPFRRSCSSFSWPFLPLSKGFAVKLAIALTSLSVVCAICNMPPVLSVIDISVLILILLITGVPFSDNKLPSGS